MEKENHDRRYFFYFNNVFKTLSPLVVQLFTTQSLLLKTLLEKEKMLVTSISSFFHNVFYLNEDKNHNFRNIEIVVGNCFEFGSVQKTVFR